MKSECISFTPHGFESVGKLFVYLPLRLLGRLSVGRARPIACSEVAVLSTNSRSGTGTRASLGQRRHRQFSSWWFQRTCELRTCEGCRTLSLAGKQGVPFDNSFSQLLLNNAVVFDSKIFTLEFSG